MNEELKIGYTCDDVVQLLVIIFIKVPVSMASVNVLCPNGRRVTVKIDPNSPLMQVMQNHHCTRLLFTPHVTHSTQVVEQACTKQKLDASHFVLK